jgi:hypothetical protein
MTSRIAWNSETAAALLIDPARGGVGLEDCLVVLENGKLLDVAPNLISNHRSHTMYISNINSYAYWFFSLKPTRKSF